MADNRSRLEKLLGMLGSEHEGERSNAATMLREMALKEKKTLVELCMSGPERVVIQERIVYRDRPETSAGHNFRQRQEEWANQQNYEEAIRRRREEAKRQQRAEEAARARRQERYRGAFDDAELSDEERAAARERRAKAKANRKILRALLDELSWAYDHRDEGDLDFYEVEFAATVPNQYEFDDQLTHRQVKKARMIISKVKRNMGESPI